MTACHNRVLNRVDACYVRAPLEWQRIRDTRSTLHLHCRRLCGATVDGVPAGDIGGAAAGPIERALHSLLLDQRLR
jgi:hypothetical protein